MLDCVFYLLSKSRVMEDKERGDPILLARTISQMVSRSTVFEQFVAVTIDGEIYILCTLYSG